MGELQFPGAHSVADDERQYRAPFRRAPQYRWPAPQPPQPSAFAPWRRAPAPPRPPDYRRSASYPGKPDEPYQERSGLDSMRSLEHYLTDIMRADTSEHMKGAGNVRVIRYAHTCIKQKLIPRQRERDGEIRVTALPTRAKQHVKFQRQRERDGEIRVTALPTNHATSVRCADLLFSRLATNIRLLFGIRPIRLLLLYSLQVYSPVVTMRSYRLRVLFSAQDLLSMGGSDQLPPVAYSLTAFDRWKYCFIITPLR
ncbi:hypothetical protein evm_008146 [Chilo suppressalis]|nr:hypothetical protein evm_008146 [Chilo suppressalis]